MTGDLSEAEDAVQEAYIQAWRRWPRIRAYEDPEAWLRVVAYRITVNSWHKARNRLTAHRAGRHHELPGLSPDLVALVSALRKIPETQRRAIVLHHLAGLSVEEIAHETGAPTGTVKADRSPARGTRLCGHDRSPDPATLREHRGDGHFAALAAAGIDGCEAIVVRCAKDISRDPMQPTRGWTDEQWGTAADRLTERGWIGEDATMTAAGRAAHDAVEAAAARSAARPAPGTGWAPPAWPRSPTCSSRSPRPVPPSSLR
jgi:RNA polymerase sigma-70 factor (ECF subfamily)